MYHIPYNRKNEIIIVLSPKIESQTGENPQLLLDFVSRYDLSHHISIELDNIQVGDGV